MPGPGYYNEPPVVYPGGAPPGASTSRSTRFRKAWHAFERTWLAPARDVLEAHKHELLLSPSSDPPFDPQTADPETLAEWDDEQHRAREAAIHAAQDEFYERARAEWAARLEGVGLRFGEWGYATPMERAIVEKALGMPVTSMSRMASQRSRRASEPFVSRTVSGRSRTDSGPGYAGGATPIRARDYAHTREFEEEIEQEEAESPQTEYQEQRDERVEETELQRTESAGMQRGNSIRRRWGTLTRKLKPALKKPTVQIDEAQMTEREVHRTEIDMEGEPDDEAESPAPGLRRRAQTTRRQRRARMTQQDQAVDFPYEDEDEDPMHRRPYVTYRSPAPADVQPVFPDEEYGEEYGTPPPPPPPLPGAQAGRTRSDTGWSRQSGRKMEYTDYVSEESGMEREEREERRREVMTGESGRRWGGGRRKLRKRVRPAKEPERGVVANVRRIVGRSRSRTRPPSLT
ncbi:hypothetical protein GLOTRDRAFT_137195 [Gloeophyllum trabeum ATCC 11539]|uniref:Uncharacterized protein n=1 Tax=Gloeophyllum trabeum (strain ATCC 11539 / FP-39264 / Madison 617) TaxID=670483 RepID=S7RYN2_GLOTA|nr:uncharacterized protein GLOTRDRAFT_137195 [Gloeophyllum trabeum ATCC 11539]EPQ58494.1 hypothetical protein GLOTRDRAFT_137195 [Gloeophyllum trabeum ATCC 11539]